ncbi:MAG: helix-turn-helix domain-containing protein [Devosia sp.]|nr:helix-turn-helix domain-containing protein [Devosia sp.]
MRRAKDLLKSSGEPLSGIALMLGFSDQSHFNRVFRRHTGFTPAAFRRLAR